MSDEYNNIGSLLNYYIKAGYLPNINVRSLLPIFESNTATLGGLTYKVSSYNNNDGNAYPAWLAVDGNDATEWISNNQTPTWLKIELPVSRYLRQIVLNIRTECTITIHGSNDDSVYELVETLTKVPNKTDVTYNVRSEYAYKYYRFSISGITVVDWGAIRKLEMYGF